MRSLAFAAIVLLAAEFAFAQNNSFPVLHMANTTNPNDLDGSGNPFTSTKIEVKGFDNFAAGQAGAQRILSGPLVTAVENPCLRPDNLCVQECANLTMGLYQCFCSKGYEDKGTQAVPPSVLPQRGFVCEDIDECLQVAPCGKGQESCNNTIGSYNCTCVSGYTVSPDLEFCLDYDECANSTLNDCNAAASCINFDGGYRCECNQGYTGDGLNCTDIDECASGNVTCGGRGTCSNTDGSFNCNCDFGFEQGIDNSTGLPTCVDIDECLQPGQCTNPDTECINTIGRFRCDCKSGFIGDGINCTDVDECVDSTLNDCHQNATCANTIGGYNCTCHPDFLGDGFKCNEGELSYCFRAEIEGSVTTMRRFGDSFLRSRLSSALGTLFRAYRFDPTIENFFVNGYNVTLEPSARNRLIALICFRRISRTADDLADIFRNNDPGRNNLLNSVFWVIRDYDECLDNFHNCDSNATCLNTMGDAVCTCPDNRFDQSEADGDRSGLRCVEPIEFECLGTQANISLLTPYWTRKFINVRNVFVNQGCSGTKDNDWHRYTCDGIVTANTTHLKAEFRVQDVIPPGGFAINRIDTTFICLQPTQQNFTTNITADDNFVDPGVQTVDQAESSLKPLIFSGGFQNAVVEGVKTGEKACVKLEDPNIPDNIKIMVEELHTSAPGDPNKFTLLRNYCPVSIPGLEIETSNGGICFTMHRPQASTLLEVQLVVNLCTTEDCPTPQCSRSRRSLSNDLSRSKRSEQLQAISFLIKIDPEDTCDRECGAGACLLDYFNRKQCICPEASVKTSEGTCKATRSPFDFNFGVSDNKNSFVILAVLGGVFLLAVLVFVVVYTRKQRSASMNSGKEMELRGVYNNAITHD